MSRKRRMFNIEMPADDGSQPAGDAPAPSSDAPRRGPMASAIAENAEALRQRRDTADAIRAENDALAHEYVALREAGNVVQFVPLEEVHTRLLARDRIAGEDLELEDLVRSIRDVGLSNPIRVIPRPDGDGYELVQGLRRLSAYRRLVDQAVEESTLSADKVSGRVGQGDWSRIPALILPGAPDIAGLYRRMVDENVIRKELSFAEMARAAQNYAADPDTDANNLADAVAALFQSAAYSKRSYIKSFAYLLDRIGPLLAYPTEIPRALGVSLAREIKDKPDLVDRIGEGLGNWDDRTVEDELGVLRAVIGPKEAGSQVHARGKERRAAGQGGRTKTTFHIQSSAGQVKCMAAQGRLEIKVNRDFSSIDRARLEQAIASLIDGLG